jgi:hypothetical protein
VPDYPVGRVARDGTGRAVGDGAWGRAAHEAGKDGRRCRIVSGITVATARLPRLAEICCSAACCNRHQRYCGGLRPIKRGSIQGPTGYLVGRRSLSRAVVPRVPDCYHCAEAADWRPAFFSRTEMMRLLALFRWVSSIDTA